MSPSREPIPIGFIYSTHGPYAAIGRAALDGARMALDEINADPDFPFLITPACGDPAGMAENYVKLAQGQIAASGCRHIVGTITSSSRKDVLPIVERSDALLWYAFPYEGYETSDHVIYLGATANQHIVPLFDYVVPHFGDRPFLVGSNYIWGWEVNRVARELLAAQGAEPAGERYLPVGDVDVDHLVEAVREKRPDFILSNLIGPSSHAFIRVFAALGRKDPAFGPDLCPIVSCNLTEADTADIGPDGAGLLTTAVYFDAMETAANRDFLMRARRRYGPSRRFSSCFTAVYAAVRMLAEAMRAAGTDDPAQVKRVVTSKVFETPFGQLTVDAATGHAALRPQLGKVRGDGAIDIIHSAGTAIAPDPYLVRHAAERLTIPCPGRSNAAAGPNATNRLRLVT